MVNIEEKLNRWYDEGHYYYLDSDEARILYMHAGKIISDSNCKKVLDIGAHHGNVVPHLNHETLEKYLGVDICSRAVEEGAKRYSSDRRIHFSVVDWNDVDKIGNLGAFDALYLSGVLFYIPEPKDDFIESMVRATGARLVVIQDLAITDLTSIRQAREAFYDQGYFIDFDFPPIEWGSEWRERFEWNKDWSVNILKERTLLAFNTQV
ncbi:class I SAM-dependent methyltransferase [Mesorhizobium sp. LSHC414A00]|uniref:class I SAM-dependent methyltransferase n=1 Tax=Mesorhizobium sp. LSHC414A00 TaxID=1287287 RepID=UPI0003CE41A8|nr:class I SAM-dependent methyltransferase [Mesorhizobium sp. LSHC414A00]ESX71817.1 hypothetical protein X757_21545 [Mesorhizobium sp. LSHC414A00]